MKKKILFGLFAVFIIIQFFSPTKNIASTDQPNSIEKTYDVPQNVGVILQNSCNDCHSNTTKYPWYANVQPIAWWLADHIKEGKRKLNFSEFGTYTLKKQDHKLDELTEMIVSEMPLKSYLIAHSDAKLTDEQKKILTDWANGLRNQIKTKM